MVGDVFADAGEMQPLTQIMNKHLHEKYKNIQRVGMYAQFLGFEDPLILSGSHLLLLTNCHDITLT